MKFAQKTLATIELPAGKREVILFDDDLPGFGLRIRAGGARTWVYQFKIGNQHRRLTLGSATALPLVQARRTASELHAMVRLGRDPAGEKAEGRARAAETIGAVLKAYLPYQRAHLKPRSYVEVERHLLKHCRPLHGLQLTGVDRRAVAAQIATLTTKTGPVTANRVRASLSAFFAWAIREGLAETNPVIGTSRSPEKSRDRVLSPAELKAIWDATTDDSDYSAVVRLLMLTGQRASEIAGLRWSEIVDETIVLPGERTKNGRQHRVPITKPVRAILAARPRRPDRDLLFGRRQDRPLTGWTVCKAALDQRLGEAVTHWTHHDLRRSMATYMAEKLNVAPHVIEAVLNHVSGHKHGVHGVYNIAEYESQKRRALAKWADHLLAIIEGRRISNVVNLGGVHGR
jgi:integrase